MSFCPNSGVQVWELKGLYSGNHKEQDDPRCSSVGENPKSEDRLPENVIGMATVKESLIHQSVEWCLQQPNHQFDMVERLLAACLSNVHQFERAMDMFMFGPSFAHDFHVAAGHLYSTSTLLLRDIYIALLSAIQKTRYNNGSICGDDLTMGASSIQKLRTAVITTYQDAAAVAALGQGVAAFDMLSSGTRSNMILRYSLTLIRPWYSALLRNPSLDPITIAPIFWDTVDCLIRREIPIIKFSTRDPQLVDRVAGLCLTLLPILQELCVTSYNTKTQRYPNDNLDPFTGIEQKLLSWSITPPPDITKTYSTSENRGMRTQALMYRASGFLLIHRLRNPLGVQDNLARSYADDIVLELLRYLALAKPDERLPNTALPLLLAMLEIPGLPKSLWSKIDIPSICITRRLCAFVEFIWTARQRGFAGLWFDLVDQGLDFVIHP